MFQSIRLIFLTLASTPICLCGQTFDIAAKSASTQITASTSAHDWFGAIPPPLFKIENLGDTATRLHYGFSRHSEDVYVVQNHPVFNNPSIDMDSLQASYGESILFEGFDNQTEIKADKKRKKKSGFLGLGGQFPGISYLLLLAIIISIAFRLPMRTQKSEVQLP